MKNVLKKIIVSAAGIVLIAGVSLSMTKPVYATETTDAQAQAQALQLQLLMQTPEYQAALKAQKEQIAKQQQQALQAQAAAIAQYQALLQQQYQAALQVYNNAQYLQQMSVNQAFLLNSTQAQQKASYEAMINKLGLDYKTMLMNNFTRDQQAGLKAFMGYYGL